MVEGWRVRLRARGQGNLPAQHALQPHQKWSAKQSNPATGTSGRAEVDTPRLRTSDLQSVDQRRCKQRIFSLATVMNPLLGISRHSVMACLDQYMFSLCVTYILNGRGAQRRPSPTVLRSLHVSHDHHRPWKTKKQDRVRDSTLTTLRIRIELRTERCLLARTRIRGRAPADAPKREAKIRVRFGERIAGEKHEEKISLHFFWLCKII